MLTAEAYFWNNKHNKRDIKGSIFFQQQTPLQVRVDIRLSNVPIGVHGIHIHEYPIECISGKDCCLSAGGHFNGDLAKLSVNEKTGKVSMGTPHGSWFYNTPRHVGDLCNNITSLNGTVEFSYIDELISLWPESPNYIVGRSIIIHKNRDDGGLFKDDLESQITGNAGERIACANITD